jgi:predicted MFS family arabinose efflux permease
MPGIIVIDLRYRSPILSFFTQSLASFLVLLTGAQLARGKSSMVPETDITATRSMVKLAFRFVLLIGIVSFFADMTYEGARSITGPFLESLGASAAMVGFVAGLGELFGYGLRSFSGYFADKTHSYWAVTFVGYSINLLAVPALALAGNWPVAAVLIVAERTGRAIRRPAVEVMISRAGKQLGQGRVFGFNEALDQAGATIGPLITAFVLYRRGGYRHAFAVLLISAILCLITVTIAWALYRRPHELDDTPAQLRLGTGFPRSYWIYLAAGALIAAGFADFSLIAFHFQKSHIVPHDLIPVSYAVAMAAGAIASLVVGKLFDKLGLPIVVLSVAVAAVFAPLVFLGGTLLAFVGMVLWGLGMGVQDSALKAILSGVVGTERRGTAFGVFDTAFGIAWFIGSVAMGLLYEVSIPGLVVFSVALQMLALPVLWFARSRSLRSRRDVSR